MIKKMTTIEEFDQMIELNTYAFNYTMSDLDKESFINLCQHSSNYGVKTKEGLLTNKLMVVPLKVNLFGVDVKMGGIGSVASYPENRGEGGISQLFSVAFEDMKEEGVTLSYLAPFSQPFYRKYGYETIFDHNELTVKGKDIGQLPSEKKGKLIRVNWQKNPEWRETIKSLYHETLEKENGSVIREDWWWDQKFSKRSNRQFVLCFNETNEAVGYLLYYTTPQEMVICEATYLSGFAVKKLAGFISSHGSTFESFKYITRTNEDVLSLFPENRDVTQKLHPLMMAKIISFESIIEHYPFKVDTAKCFKLGIEDKSTPWNEGTWEVTISEGKGEARLISDQILDSADFSGSIQHWTQVLLGYRNLSSLVFLDELTDKNNRMKEFDALLPKGTPVLFDYF